jgi:integrase
MQRGKKALTQRAIVAMRPTRGVQWFSDRDLPGFAVVVHPSGVRSFMVRYVSKVNGLRRMASIGQWGVVTLEQARSRAREILSAAALGADPLAESRCPTWFDWTSTYFERTAPKRKRPEEHARYLGFTEEKRKKGTGITDPTFRDIRQKWGPLRLDQITVDDIERARERVREGGKIKADRWLVHLAACFAAAVKAELIPRNPAQKVERERGNPARDRVLSDEEMKALIAAADVDDDPHARAAVLLAVWTGARKGELLTLEWKHVDLGARMVRQPDSKSGRARLLALPPDAVKMLEKLPRLGPYVIAGKDPKKKRFDLKGPWERIAKRAGLEAVTMHDVRRTWGLALTRSVGVHVASKGLGHQSITETEAVYAPESFAAVQKAVDERAKLLPFPVKATG